MYYYDPRWKCWGQCWPATACPMCADSMISEVATKPTSTVIQYRNGIQPKQHIPLYAPWKKRQVEHNLFKNTIIPRYVMPKRYVFLFSGAVETIIPPKINIHP
jgi:hypothetical protein